MWNACTCIFHVCDCSATSLNSQFEWGKSISLRCMRKGNVESVMLEVFELCLLILVYSEDLVSEKTSAAGCISISFIYVSASENTNTIIKLFRKHVINIYLLYFFYWSSSLVSVWIFPIYWQLIFFFPLAAVTYVLSFSGSLRSQQCVLLLETVEYSLEIKSSLVAVESNWIINSKTQTP